MPAPRGRFPRMSSRLCLPRRERFVRQSTVRLEMRFRVGCLVMGEEGRRVD